MMRLKVMSWLAVAFAIPLGAAPASAKSVYVKADGTSHVRGRLGSETNPFRSLADAEGGSAQGDTIYVLPSAGPLDGGIQLKDGQNIVGLGPDVTNPCGNAAHAQVTNSTNAHLSGDAVRLANNNTVKNLHIARAYRGGVLGINVASPNIRDNLFTENMAQHTVQELQQNFVIFQAQRNHYGAITLFACGATSPNECQDEDPATPGIVRQEGTIKGNVINNVAVEGIVILNDAGVLANYDIVNNSVDGVSLQYPGFLRTDLVAPVPVEVVRSRAFTILVGNNAHSYVNIDRFNATHLAPPGDFASDGVVFVTFGSGAIVSGDVDNVSITNPDFTGEIVNADSLELTAFGSNATFDVRVRDSVFRDSPSTLIKLLEVNQGSNNSYFLDVAKTELTNVNPRVPVEASLGAIAYFKLFAPATAVTNTVDITLNKVELRGHRRGLLINNLSGYKIQNLKISAERTTFADSLNEGFRLFNQAGTIDNIALDFGGGALGSNGHNSFVNNGTSADADVTIVNLGTQDFGLNASKNYWGGSAPVTGPGQNLFSVGPAHFVVDGYLKRDPN